MGASEVLWVLIGGVVIGLLGKFVAPGHRDDIPLWLTVVCGLAGMFGGTYLYVALGGSETTTGVDWLRHATQIGVAAVLVVVAASLAGRSRKT